MATPYECLAFITDETNRLIALRDELEQLREQVRTAERGEVQRQAAASHDSKQLLKRSAIRQA